MHLLQDHNTYIAKGRDLRRIYKIYEEQHKDDRLLDKLNKDLVPDELLYNTAKLEYAARCRVGGNRGGTKS